MPGIGLRTNAVDRQQRQREQNAVPQVLNANMFFTASTNRFMRESCDSPLSYNLESAARLANLFLATR